MLIFLAQVCTSSKPPPRILHFIWKNSSTAKLGKRGRQFGLGQRRLGILSGLVPSGRGQNGGWMVIAGWAAQLSICLSHYFISAQVGARARCIGLSRRIRGPCSARNEYNTATMHKEARLSFLETDVHKSLPRLIRDSAHTFRTIACASKQVAVIFAKLRIQYLEKLYTNQISASPIADHLQALANSCFVSVAVNEQKQKHPPLFPTATTLFTLRSAQRCRATELCPHRLASRSASLTSLVTWNEKQRAHRRRAQYERNHTRTDYVVYADGRRGWELQSSDEKLTSVITDAGRAILWQKIQRIRKVSLVPNQEGTTMCSLTHLRKTPSGKSVRIKPKRRLDRITRSTDFGDLITADHKFLNVENESRCGHKNVVIVQDDFANRIQSSPMKDERHIGNDVL